MTASADREPAARSSPASRARRVIAAVDGSSHSVAALAWADADARLRGSELAVITVCGRGTISPPAADVAGPHVAGREDACRDLQARLLADLPADPSAHRTARILHGDPVRELTRAATDSDVLVSGTRGTSPLRSLLLGSVAQGCAEHAPCPVVIVPAATRPQPAAGAPVLAGLDPSAAARHVLRFAVEEAALRSAQLIAVHVLYPDYAADQPAPGDRDLLRPVDSAWGQLDALIRAEPAAAGVPVHPIVVPGDPGQVLLDWTYSAALAVVGSRRSDRLHTALLGTVTSQLMRHGHCPIAAVPAA